jgi:small subunit ribosomal protein S9
MATEEAAPKSAPAPKAPAAPAPASHAPAAAPAPAASAPASQAPAAPAPAAAAAATPAAPEAPKAPAPVVEEVSLTAPPLPEGTRFVFGTGRRKEAVARVRIRPGSGGFVVNKKPMDQYFGEHRDRDAAVAPLRAAKMVRSYDIWVNVDGGGRTGQACAVKLGLARALLRAAPDSEGALRDLGLLTRDARMKERKKYGQKGARKRFQYSKR